MITQVEVNQALDSPLVLWKINKHIYCLAYYCNQNENTFCINTSMQKNHITLITMACERYYNIRGLSYSEILIYQHDGAQYSDTLLTNFLCSLNINVDAKCLCLCLDVVAVSFIGGGNPEKTTDLSQANDKLYHLILYTSPRSRFELTTLVVIGTDCIGSCKSNYHTITTTPVLYLGNRQISSHGVSIYH